MRLIANSSGGGIAGTLDSNYWKGQGERAGVEREYIVVDDLPEDSRDTESRWTSGELQRTGRLQRHVGDE